jgi:hypothetical protein
MFNSLSKSKHMFWLIWLLINFQKANGFVEYNKYKILVFYLIEPLK